MGVTLGMLLGTIALSVVSWLVPGPMFLAWGWRIPFLLSAVLVVFGLFIRQRIDETPAFREAKATERIARVPIVETLRHHRPAVLQAVGLKVVETAPFYIFSTFGITYATRYAGIPNASALNALTVAASLTTLTIPLAGILADRLGRKPLYVAGTLAIMAFAFPYFMLVSLRSALWFGVATSLALAVCWAPITAVLGTVYSEIFSTDVRYTGVTLGYQIGSALAGGTAPLIATYLLAVFSNSWLPVAAYLVLASSVSLYTISKTRETRHADLRTGRDVLGIEAPS